MLPFSKVIIDHQKLVTLQNINYTNTTCSTFDATSKILSWEKVWTIDNFSQYVSDEGGDGQFTTPLVATPEMAHFKMILHIGPFIHMYLSLHEDSVLKSPLVLFRLTMVGEGKSSHSITLSMI